MKVVESLHPLKSAVVPFAAITGVPRHAALAVAFRARNRWRASTTSAMKDLTVALVRRFFRTPLEFFFPRAR